MPSNRILRVNLSPRDLLFPNLSRVQYLGTSSETLVAMMTKSKKTL